MPEIYLERFPVKVLLLDFLCGFGCFLGTSFTFPDVCFEQVCFKKVCAEVLVSQNEKLDFKNTFLIIFSCIYTFFNQTTDFQNIVRIIEVIIQGAIA